MKKENGSSKSALLWIIFTVLILIVIIAAVLVFVFKVKIGDSNTNTNTTQQTTETPSPSTEPTHKPSSEDVSIIPTMEDEIDADSAWTPTFELVWNDLMDELVGGKVEFNDGKEPDYLENLNKQLFKEADISEDYIYKKFGKTSNKLKEEILEGIKDKFDEESDIIDPDEDWGDKESDGYTFYTMLFRVFKFEKPFDIYEDEEEGYFGEKDEYSNVKYFGLNKDSDEELFEQVHVLFYEDDDTFAFSVDTKEGDQLIFSRGVDGKTFADIYSNIEDKAEKYDNDNGRTELMEIDKVKIPFIEMNLFREYKELEEHPFNTKEDEESVITRAIQTIKLSLDNEGGKIKSEALIQTKEMAAEEEDEVRPFNLTLNKEFTMFVKEKEKDLPYFALNVSDISKFQKDVVEE